MNKSTLVEALVLETATDKINAQTGAFQSLTKLITVSGDIITVWHQDNKCPAKGGDEVVLVSQESGKVKDDGTPYINYSIVPEDFAKKILAARK